VETNAGTTPNAMPVTSAASNVKVTTGSHRYLVQPWYRDPIAHEREQATMTKLRDDQARNASAGGEHQALREHLTQIRTSD